MVRLYATLETKLTLALTRFCSLLTKMAFTKTKKAKWKMDREKLDFIIKNVRFAKEKIEAANKVAGQINDELFEQTAGTIDEINELMVDLMIDLEEWEEEQNG